MTNGLCRQPTPPSSRSPESYDQSGRTGPESCSRKERGEARCWVSANGRALRKAEGISNGQSDFNALKRKLQIDVIRCSISAGITRTTPIGITTSAKQTLEIDPALRSLKLRVLPKGSASGFRGSPRLEPEPEGEEVPRGFTRSVNDSWKVARLNCRWGRFAYRHRVMSWPGIWENRSDCK